jgi:hypothetical protein
MGEASDSTGNKNVPSFVNVRLTNGVTRPGRFESAAHWSEATRPFLPSASRLACSSWPKIAENSCRRDHLRSASILMIQRENCRQDRLHLQPKRIGTEVNTPSQKAWDMLSQA